MKIILNVKLNTMNRMKILHLVLIVVLVSCTKGNNSSEVMKTQNIEQAKKKKQIEREKDKFQTKKTKIAFNEKVHDFGDIAYEDEVETTFKIKNVGEHALIIFKAEASCGCTIPEKPTKPISPGEEGDLKVAFKPNKEGAVSKKVTLTTNTESGREFVTIKANVAPKKQK